MLEVRVLGPLEIRANGTAMPLGSRKQQTVLAMLALHAGRPVSLDELVDELWPSRPPPSAVANTRMYAANLRRLFDSCALARGLIAREGAGYLLRAHLAQIDRLAFEADCRRAREVRAAGDARAAASILHAAEARWRGPMLAGVPRGFVLTACCTALEEERLSIVEERAEMHLASGQPEEAARFLREHVRMHPLREQAHALLMRALSEIGDVAGALDAYRAARAVLVEQLGIEPGKELQRLHQIVLTGEPTSGAAPLCWLPRGIADFTGRAELVTSTLHAVKDSAGGPVIKLIDGMAGSGKTTLAVHVAHRLAGSYPDAQLFIDLQGHSDRSPLKPAVALVTLLRQLDISTGRIPADLDGRVALWRAEVAKRRVVVVLDNAASTDQVNPLMPTSPGCVVLLTSRRRLAALDGGHPVSLPILRPEEAIELFAKVAGQSRIDDEPSAAQEVVHRCGHLPLAIRLAGARLAHRPGWRVADLADRLRDDLSVLPELAVENRSIARAFALSYDPLREPSKRMFRLLGLWPGSHFDAVTAAALSGLPLPEADSVIEQLVDHHLVEEPTAGRFRLHDLVHEYAHSLAMTAEAPSDRQAVVGWVLDHYLHAVATATEPLEARWTRGQLVLEAPHRQDLLSAASPVGLQWMEAERQNLKALVRCAFESEHLRYSWRLARAAWRFYYVRGFYDDLVDTHVHGLDAAERLDDKVAIATMHNYLASGFARTGRYRETLLHLDFAIKMRESIGDKRGANVSRANLSVVYLWLGRLDEAVAISASSLEEWRRTSDDSIPHALPNLGLPLMILGRYEEALRISRYHLFLGRERKDDFHIGNAIFHIGQVRSRLGHHRAAIRLIKASLSLKRRSRTRFSEAEVLSELAVLYRHVGDIEEAQRHHRAALVAAEASGERHVRCTALNDLGFTLIAAGQCGPAIEMHREALASATKIGYPYEQARALAGLATCLEGDDPAEAGRLWKRALALYRKMNVPEQYEIERRISDRPPVHL